MRSLVVLLVVVLFCGNLVTTVCGREHLVLTADNHVALLGEVTDESVSRWMMAIDQKVVPGGSSLLVYVDSPGGSIDDGMFLIEQLVHLRENYNMTFRCVVRRAFSMAFGIVQLGCSERLITPNGVLMQHQASYGMSGSHHVMRSRLELYRRQIEQFETQQADVLQLSLDAFRALTNNEWWLDAADALDNYAADTIVTVGCDPELSKDIVTESIFVALGPFSVRQRVQVSRCPLIGVIGEADESGEDYDN